MTKTSDPMDLIVERLVGETGEPGQVAETARAAAERALPDFLEALNDKLSWAVEAEVGAVEIVRFAEARPDAEANVAVVVAAAPSSRDALMLVIEPDTVSLLVAALFGSDPDSPVVPITRPLSPIELDVAAMAFGEFARAFCGSGERSFDFRLPLSAPISGPELKKLVIRDGPAVRIPVVFSAPAGRGRMLVVMPQRVLLKHRGDRQDAKGAAAQASESHWHTRFGEEVLRSAVRLDATIALEPMSLGELTTLQVGQLIELPEGAAANTRLSARDNTIFICEFGKLGQNYTVRIRQPFDAGQDLLEGIISG